MGGLSLMSCVSRGVCAGGIRPTRVRFHVKTNTAEHETGDATRFSSPPHPSLAVSRRILCVHVHEKDAL